ncbi:MAG: hypothetical protein RIK87_05040 [Fuerstiella sp.]
MQSVINFLFLIAFTIAPRAAVLAESLLAGAAKVDITSDAAGPAHGRLHTRALVLKSDATTAVMVTLDVVAIGEIGAISNDFLGNVRNRVNEQLGIDPKHILINASHCHGIPCDDVEDRTVRAIVEAAQNLVPVQVGVGHGHEDRIMENRRLKLKDGREIDVRHAYAMPRDEDVAEVGPIDPEIGVLKLNREDGRTLAVLYNFACHPIQGVPSGANTADMTGFSSEVIEDNLDEGTVALFVQGCGGDINPVFYKEVHMPRDAEPLGNLLGLSTLKTVRKVTCDSGGPLQIINETIELPRADLAERINVMQDERERLLRSLGGTTLSLKTFLPLVVKYRLTEDFPSYYSHSYLNEQQLGRGHLSKLDADNRRAMDQYIRNIHTMEQLTRLQTNLRLLEKHQAHYVAAGKRTVDVEVAGLQVGDFRLITFPGELTVQIGLNLKDASPYEHTFIAGYTNGYIYYSPTAEQLRNVGNAQEDSDCLLAPEWQAVFEGKAMEVLSRLQ